jgi:hypothetical protein
MIENFLKSIDFLAPTITLKIKKENSLKSCVGGVLTIVVAIISIMAFMGFGLDLIEKKMPQVNYKKELEPTVSLNLTEDSIIFGIVEQTTLQEIPDIDRKIYYYFTLGEIFGNNTPTRVTDYPAEKCSSEVLDKVKKFLLVDQKYYWCIPRNMTFTINGNSLQGKYNMLRLNADICKNSTTKKDCYSQEYSRTNMGRLKMQYIIKDSYADNYNYTEPGIQTIYVNDPMTNTNTMSRQLIYYKTIDYYTDIGWIVQNLRNQEYKAIDRIDQLYIPALNSTTLFSHMFINSFYKDIYSRSYIKIQGVFAYIGGFISLAFKIMSVLTYYLVEPEMIKIFSDSLLNLQNSQNKKSNYSSKITSVRSKSNKDSSINKLSIPIKPEEKKVCIQVNDNHITEEVKLKTQNNFQIGKKFKMDSLPNLNCFTTAFRLCNKKSKNTKVFEKWKIIYCEKISVENFSSNFRVSELMKKVLFDDVQIAAFETLSFPFGGKRELDIDLIKSMLSCEKNNHNNYNVKLRELMS